MTDKTETTEIKQANLNNSDRPWLFQKGVSGNPLGRPKGSKNKISQLLQNISEDDQKIIADRIIDFAKGGYHKHFKVVLPYILPKAKAPNTQLIEDDAEVLDLKLDTPEDIKKASEMIIKAMITGRISVAEAEGMIRIIERYK
jgi:hypothetical protein